MNQDELIIFKNWFAGYCASFSTPVREDQRNISIKQDHTQQVCLNALRISSDLKLNEQETLLAETIALFHDIGRFLQYQQYKTFDDSISVNHAALGITVLLEDGVLQGLPKKDQELILHAVTLHNVFSLPEELDDRTRLFAQLARDADKLDIMRVVIQFFEQEAGDRAEAVALGLPDAPGYSPEVLASLMRGEMARKADLKLQNDFKLLQLAWLYDFNFASSLRMVLERGYIDQLAGMLPASEEFKRAVEHIRSYVDGKLRAG